MFDEISIDKDITDKIRWARSCYTVNKDILLNDTSVTNHLINLKKAIQYTRFEMKRTGMLDECRECAENRGGSCCGSGIENRYSGTLLLINLMLGSNLPEKRSDPKDCLFLGREGCALLARHVICVNYACKDIFNRINGEKLAKLRENEGIELELIFLLNEKIGTLLRRK